MNQRARIYLIPLKCLLPVLLGEKRIVNIPGDAHLAAADYGVQGLGVRVHSNAFQEVPQGQQLPVFTAVLEKRL